MNDLPEFVLKMITDRLTLIPFEEEDLETFHQINTDPVVRKFLWDDKVIEEEISADILSKCHSLFEEQKWGLWKLIENFSGDVTGYAGLWDFFDEGQPQLIYALLPEFQGKGYATEASQEVIHYAFNQLHFPHLLTSIDPPIVASHKVCQRLGMKYIETRKIDGKTTLFYRIENH